MPETVSIDDIIARAQNPVTIDDIIASQAKPVSIEDIIQRKNNMEPIHAGPDGGAYPDVRQPGEYAQFAPPKKETPEEFIRQIAKRDQRGNIPSTRTQPGALPEPYAGVQGMDPDWVASVNSARRDEARKQATADMTKRLSEGATWADLVRGATPDTQIDEEFGQQFGRAPTDEERKLYRDQRQKHSDYLQSAEIKDYVNRAVRSVGSTLAESAAGAGQMWAGAAQAIDDALPDWVPFQSNTKDETMRPEYKMAEAIESLAEEILPDDDERTRGSFWAEDLPSGVASMLLFMAGGAAGRATGASSSIVSAVLGAGMESSNMYRKARRAGKSNSAALLAAGLAAPGGAIEAFGVESALGRLGKAAGGRTMRRVLSDAAAKVGKTSAIEATQEGFQSLSTDIVTKLMIDHDHQIGKSFARSFAAGGLIGAFADIGATAIGHRMNKRLSEAVNSAVVRDRISPDIVGIKQEKFNADIAIEETVSAVQNDPSSAVELLQRLPQQVHALMEENPSNERRAAAEGQVQELRRSVPEAREITEEALRALRGEQFRDAPRGLQQAAGSGMGVSRVPPIASRGGGVDTRPAQPALTAFDSLLSPDGAATLVRTDPARAQAVASIGRPTRKAVADALGVPENKTGTAADRKAVVENVKVAAQPTQSTDQPALSGPQLANGTEEAQFGDESGALDVTGAASGIGRGLRAGAAFLKRFGTSRGDLQEADFKAKVNADSMIAAGLKAMKYQIQDFNLAVKNEIGKPTPEQYEYINAFLQSQNDGLKLPQGVQGAVLDMRDTLDALSRRMIDLGVVEGDLADTITSNLGVYLKRSYRVFDDPKWALKVPEDIRNKAKAMVRSEYPDATEDDVQGVIDNLLYEGKAADSPIALIKSGKLGSKDLSILTKRKDIPPEIRALWGEYSDNPIVNYAKSVASMTQLIAHHQMLEQMRQNGLGKWFHERPVSNESGQFIVRVAGDDNRAMSPLSGLYTTPEIRDAIAQVHEQPPSSKLFRVYMKANGLVKYSKTVASIQTHVRNILGNAGFAVANGHWRLHKFPAAFMAARAGLTGGGGEKWRNYYLELQRYGVVGESSRAGELRDFISDATKTSIDELMGSSTTRALRATGRAITDIYQVEDDFWKAYAYENEKARYRSADPSMSEDQLSQTAATIVRNTYPTYSMIPLGVRLMRRIPILGTFVSFPAEVFRVGFHTLGQIQSELRSSNPKIRAIGAQRLVGATAAAFGTYAVAKTLMHLLGITPEQEEDFRNFVPPWSENSTLWFTGHNKDGSPRYIDMSYTDPWSYLKDPIRALLRGEDWESSLMDAGTQAFAPFLSTNMLTQKVSEFHSNRTANNREVYNEQAPFLRKAEQVAAHFWDAVEPGTLTSAKRIYRGLKGETSEHGKVYDPTIETLSVVLGHRISTIDIEQSLFYKGMEYSDAMRDATRILSSVANRKGNVTPEELNRAAQDAEMSRRRIFDKAHKAARAAIRLGIQKPDVIRALRGGKTGRGVSRQNAYDIVNGHYRPLKTSHSTPTQENPRQ